MRNVISNCVEQMQPPSIEERAEAAQHGGSQAHNDQYQSDWPCLNTIEVAQPVAALPMPSALTVAAWNIERCKNVEDSAELIRASGADVVLATEVDWGMARSGQRHTTQDLARLLGFGYAFGVEFVELATGDAYETSLFADVPNSGGLHGNAILSRYPIADTALIPLDDGGGWYVRAPKGDGQFRVGGRMAMAARLGGLTLCSVHFESESDADGRAQQAQRLAESLDTHFGTGPAIIGGDLNTGGFTAADYDTNSVLNRPEPVEPCFSVFAAHGFDWRTTNTGHPTTRAAPGRPVRYPLSPLDWLFARGCDAAHPRVVPAVSSRGAYLSDHELVLCRVLL